MDRADYVTVVDADGVHGRTAVSELEDEDRTHVWVDFDRQKVQVPVELLVPEKDGTYRLPARLATFTTTAETDEEVVVPVVKETVSLSKERHVTGRVRIEKSARTEEEVVDVPLTATEVEVRRVPIDRIVDGPVSERREGDTLILPVVEEVLVVQKQLRLKEEIHITTKQTTRNRSERVTLRKEEVSVERVQPGDDTE